MDGDVSTGSRSRVVRVCTCGLRHNDKANPVCGPAGTDVDEQETIAVTTDDEQPGSEQTRVERFVSQPLPLDSIVCGDNCDVLGTFPRECIDLVVTSPPYDDLRTYGGHAWDFYGVAWQLKRVLKPGGVIVWVVNDATKDGSETGSSMRQALHFKEIGLKLWDTMIYQTTKQPLNQPRYEPKFEFMFVLSSGFPAVWNPLKERCAYAGTKTGATYRQANGEMKERHGVATIAEHKVRGNIWDIPSGNGKTEIAGDHPASFPEKLARDHILSWSNEGDIVLDPFNGSGTTTKMARAMGRRFIGIDVNEGYCEIARKRLAQKLLDFGDAG